MKLSPDDDSVALPDHRAAVASVLSKDAGWEIGQVYQARRDSVWRFGDGGDATRMPVVGLTIGMALRCLVTEGCAGNLRTFGNKFVAYGAG